MSIMLGNLSVDQIEDRLGIGFPEEIKMFMEENCQHETGNIKKGKWHCFDLPFCIICGDRETASKIYESVKHRASDCKEALQFCIQ